MVAPQSARQPARGSPRPAASVTGYDCDRSRAPSAWCGQKKSLWIRSTKNDDHEKGNVEDRIHHPEMDRCSLFELPAAVARYTRRQGASRNPRLPASRIRLVRCDREPQGADIKTRAVLNSGHHSQPIRRASPTARRIFFARKV